ncbi:MAG: SUMF1/EgtB/PvdO family nonheme iron enzyme [Magnetococcales bacterium]|nr:SUMF1/EgtB/PvdO family nonheme iron enzyme [Magnetococcales bacterium]
MALTWLHVSDFHFTSGDGYERDVVLKSLVDSVRWFREHGRQPDLIFATGDIAAFGKADEYRVATLFFNDLIAAAGVARERLFLVPGNHDVERGKGVGLARTLASAEESTAFFAPDCPKWQISQKQRAFVDWYNGYFSGIRSFPEHSSCGPVEMVEIKGCRVGVLPLNSALFCSGDDDFEKLWIGRRALDAAIGQLKELGADLRIGLIHHPLSWLSGTESANIKAKLTKSVDLLLRGHLHDADVENVAGVAGKLLHLSAGAAFQESRYPKRALYATLDNGKVTVFPIHYVDGPHEVWAHDTGLFPREPGHVKNFDLPALVGRCSSGSVSAQFWEGGRPPSWADTWGRDQFGSWVEFVVGDVRQRMRWIPPGRFWMGSPKDEAERFDWEGPRHEVALKKGFWLFDTACTQALWQEVMGENPSRFQSPDRPVERVSFEDVGRFLQRMEKRLPGIGLTLPSEAQWEYACRAGTTTPFSFGVTINTDQANYDGNYPYAGGSKGVDREQTVPVATLPSNPWGLFEMHGNVWEWCEDHWHDSYNGAPTDGRAWLDTASPDGGGRVLRGGSWDASARYVRAAFRVRLPPGERFGYLGFRCALVPVSKAGRQEEAVPVILAQSA